MYRTRQYRINKKHDLYDYCCSICHASATLYNRANFILRQYSSAIAAMKEYKTLFPNQMEVFRLVSNSLEGTKYAPKGQWLSYGSLDYLLKSTNDRAYYGLPSQANQQILKLLMRDYKSFFEAVKAYAIDKTAFTGRPHMPGYVRKGKMKTAVLTNQICRVKDENLLRFPGTKEMLMLGDISFTWKLKEVRIKPAGRDFVIDVVMEIENRGIEPKDDIPVYRKGDNTEYVFSGKRIKKGLYRHFDGTVTNADINGAANILRKVFPKVTQWDRGIVDMPCSAGCVEHTAGSCREAA